MGLGSNSEWIGFDRPPPSARNLPVGTRQLSEQGYFWPHEGRPNSSLRLFIAEKYSPNLARCSGVVRSIIFFRHAFRSSSERFFVHGGPSFSPPFFATAEVF